MLSRLLLSLPMLVCLFWAVFFCIRRMQRSSNPPATTALLLFYTAATILYSGHWLYFSGVRSFFAEWAYVTVNLSVYPLYYAYLRALTRMRKSLELPLLLLPAVVVFVLFPLNRLCGWSAENTLRMACRLCFAVQVIWVLVRGFGLLHSVRWNMDNTYSDYRSSILHPTHVMLALIGLTALASTVLNMVGRDFFSASILVDIPAVLMTVLLYALGYVAAHTELPEDTVTCEQKHGQLSSVSDEDTQELIRKIDKTMRTQMLFTNAGLTIQDLATAVNSNRTYVSNAINRTYGISFSRYISRQRIAYAQMLLCDPKYTSDHEAVADAIALSGFTSDQTFYRLFKEITGETPLQYRHKNLQ